MGTFLGIIGEEYDSIKNQFRKQIKAEGIRFDEDIFGDTILKCQEMFEDKEISRDDAIGYFWKSFRVNTIREKKYHRNSHRCEMQEYDAATLDDGGILLNNTIKGIRKRFGKKDLNNFLRHADGETYKSIGMTFSKKRYSEIKEYVKLFA